MGERRGTKALELWCRRVTDGYAGVKVENMTSSWRDGLAFCAIIHHFRPDLIDFSKLNKDDIFENNQLAFITAENHLGIPALLDPEDMVICSVPDRLSILTYLSQLYQHFVGSQGSPKTRTSQKRPTTPPELPTTSSTPTKMDVIATNAPPLGRREPCAKCGLFVFIAERLHVNKKLYHRQCFRCCLCNNQLSLANYKTEADGQFCCDPCPADEPQQGLAGAPSEGTDALSDDGKNIRLQYSFAKINQIVDESESSESSAARSAFLRNQIGDEDSSAAAAAAAAVPVAVLDLSNVDGPKTSEIPPNGDEALGLGSNIDVDTTHSEPLPAIVISSEDQSSSQQVATDVHSLDDSSRNQPNDVTTALLPTEIPNEDNLEGSDGVAEDPDSTSLESSNVESNQDAEEQTVQIMEEEANLSAAIATAESAGNIELSSADAMHTVECDEAKSDSLGDETLNASYTKEYPSELDPFASDTDENADSKMSISNPFGSYDSGEDGICRDFRASKSSLSGFTSSTPSLTATNRRKKKKPAPPPPMPRTILNVSTAETPSNLQSDDSKDMSSLDNTSSNQWDHEKLSKDEQNRHRQKDLSTSNMYSPETKTPLKTRRKKGPAPPRPVPLKRPLRRIPFLDINKELDVIEIQQQGLEKQGVKLEQMIRDKCEKPGEDQDLPLPVEVEEYILQLFEIINIKNELFRRQAELMYIRKQRRLEEEHADLEYQIRCLMEQPEVNKTDSDKAREEELIKRLVKVVEQRNEIVECLEMDRVREAEEDLSISTHLSSLALKKKDKSSADKKDKKKKLKDRKRTEKSKKVDLDKDIDESESTLSASHPATEKKAKKWFRLKI